MCNFNWWTELRRLESMGKKDLCLEIFSVALICFLECYLVVLPLFYSQGEEFETWFS